MGTTPLAHAKFTVAHCTRFGIYRSTIGFFSITSVGLAFFQTFCRSKNSPQTYLCPSNFIPSFPVAANPDWCFRISMTRFIVIGIVSSSHIELTNACFPCRRIYCYTIRFFPIVCKTLAFFQAFCWPTDTTTINASASGSMPRLPSAS